VTAAKMNVLGIYTGLDLRRQTPAFLAARFGKAGEYYHAAARGEDHRPVVAERRLVLEADGPELLADGFPVLPTLDRPHWTVVVSTPTEAQFERVRKHFRGPIENPAWARRPGTVR